MSRPVLAERVARFGTTVFSEFSALALQHEAVNLGQGFPDFDGPEEVKEAAVEAIRDGVNQYAVGTGAAELRQAIAEHAAALLRPARSTRTRWSPSPAAPPRPSSTPSSALVDPGDEVGAVRALLRLVRRERAMAGGDAALRAAAPPGRGARRWWFDRDELARGLRPATRLVLLNTPTTPPARSSPARSWSSSASCARHDAMVLSDEVYEHIVFAPARHVRAGHAARAGGPHRHREQRGQDVQPHRLEDRLGDRAAAAACTRCSARTSSSPSPRPRRSRPRWPPRCGCRTRTSRSWRRATWPAREAAARRSSEAGLPAPAPEGSYFILADIARLGFADDLAFCRHLVTQVGVAAIPSQRFYSPEHKAPGPALARFAFCKTDAVLDEGGAPAARRGSRRPG